MATVIDSLLVRLGFDRSQVSAGLAAVNADLATTATVANNTGTQLHGAGTRGSEGFNNLAKSAGKFLALIGGTVAIKHFIQQTSDSSAALDRLSQNLNTSVSGISTLSNAAELAGGSRSGLQDTLKMLSMEQTKYKLTGDSGLLGFFNYIKLSLDAATPTMQLFLQMREKLLEKTGGNRQEAFNIGKMMGVDEGTLNLILKNNKEFNDLMRPNNAVTASQAHNASALNKSLGELGQSAESLGRIFVSDSTPAMVFFLDLIQSVVGFFKANSGIVEKFFTVLAVGAGAAAVAFGVLAIATSPITLWVAGIAALAAGITLLWDDFDKWKKGSASLIPWDKWKKEIDDALQWIDNLWEKIKDFNMFGLSSFGSDIQSVRGKDPRTISEKTMELLTPSADPLGYINRTNNYSSGGNRSVENNIGEIKIYTKSNDEAREIAGSINYLLTAQANTGLS